MKLTGLKEKLVGRRHPNRTSEHFRKLSSAHIRFLYNLALRFTGNRYDAEDIVQETLLIAFDRFEQLRDDGKFKSWTFTILRNVYLKSLSKSKDQHKMEFEDGIDYEEVLTGAAAKLDLEEAVVKKVEATQVQNFLAQMPEKYQSPLILYYMEELSYRQISDFLNVPIGTVMSRMSRGKQLLKKQVLRSEMADSRRRKVRKLRSAI